MRLQALFCTSSLAQRRKLLLGVLLALLVPLSAAGQQHAVRDDGVTVILHPDGRWEVVPVAAPAAAAAVRATPVRVFFGNLHSHTSYSDGSATPADAFRHARDEAGLDFLAVTEHNHAGAPSSIPGNPALYNGPQATSLKSAAGRFTEDGVFVALYGQEFSSIGSGNHANVFEIDDVIQTFEVPNGRWDNLLNTWLPAHPDSQGQPPILLLNHPRFRGASTRRSTGSTTFPTRWRNGAPSSIGTQSSSTSSMGHRTPTVAPDRPVRASSYAT